MGVCCIFYIKSDDFCLCCKREYLKLRFLELKNEKLFNNVDIRLMVFKFLY